MSGFLHFLLQAPGSTVAAFLAVAVALRATHRDIRERRLVQRQQAVIDVNTQSLEWTSAAMHLFASVRDYQRTGASTDLETLNGPTIENFMAATTKMDRALQTARMTCNDHKLRVWIAHAQLGLYNLLGELEAMPGRSIDHADVLQKFIADGLNYSNGFNAAINEFGVRGAHLYTVEGGLRFRLERWRWNRNVASEKKIQPIESTNRTPDDSANRSAD